ncbi:MAG: hypothetical protein OQK51_12930 [Kangiellaceae bacterium]|nr:hypothetical protein [Kangiellaceae bacterium]
MKKILTLILLIAFSNFANAEYANCEAGEGQDGLMWAPECTSCENTNHQSFVDHAKDNFQWGPEGHFDGAVGVIVPATSSTGIPYFANVTVITSADGTIDSDISLVNYSEMNQSCEDPDAQTGQNTGGSNGGGSGSFFVMFGVLHNYNMPGDRDGWAEGFFEQE